MLFKVSSKLVLSKKPLQRYIFNSENVDISLAPKVAIARAWRSFSLSCRAVVGGCGGSTRGEEWRALAAVGLHRALVSLVAAVLGYWTFSFFSIPFKIAIKNSDLGLIIYFTSLLVIFPLGIHGLLRYTLISFDDAKLRNIFRYSKYFLNYFRLKLKI